MVAEVCKYRMRNEMVLFRLVNKGTTGAGKIVMPDKAEEGKERIVVAVGPKVDDLKPGDKIYVIGQVGLDAARLAGHSDLFITKESNVVMADA